MASKRPDPIDPNLAGGEPDRYVFVPLHRIPCPRCGGEKHQTTRTERYDENDKAHRKKCLACSHSFFAVFVPVE